MVTFNLIVKVQFQTKNEIVVNFLYQNCWYQQFNSWYLQFNSFFCYKNVLNNKFLIKSTINSASTKKKIMTNVHVNTLKAVLNVPSWTFTLSGAVQGPDPALTLQESNTCDLLCLELYHHVIRPPFITSAVFISFACLSTGPLCLKLAVLHRCCFWASWVTLWVLCMQRAGVCVICCTWILTVYNISTSHSVCSHYVFADQCWFLLITFFFCSKWGWGCRPNAHNC